MLHSRVLQVLLLCALFLPWPVAGASLGPASTLADSEESAAGAHPDELDLALLEQRLREHVIVLTSPFFEGRTPGTVGMERARDYAQMFLAASGAQPAFDGKWRQDFDYPGPVDLVSQHLAAGEIELNGRVEFNALGLGSSGQAAGELVFCGYGIQNGPEGYASFPGDERLDGRIALIVRFEPRNEAGRSRWTESGNWSPRAGLADKVRAAAERGAAAVLVANPPGSFDPRSRRIMTPEEAGRMAVRVPVMHLTAEGATRLVAAAGGDFAALTRAADEKGGIQPLGLEVRLAAELARTRVPAQNLGALLPGSGGLAEEIIVVGAHLDHVGNGRFGSPADGGVLHPGADDNASGSASVLMLAERLARRVAEWPEDQPRRTLLLLLFDAEESGLLGSRHYVAEPIRSIETHAFMINLDMVGRIREERVSVQGERTSAGLGDWLAPHFARSPLELVPSRSISARSDHASFLAAQVPALFFTNAHGHPDYHRPTDTWEKVEFGSMARLVLLVEELALAAAARAEPWVYTDPAEGLEDAENAPRRRQAPARAPR